MSMARKSMYERTNDYLIDNLEMNIILLTSKSDNKDVLQPIKTHIIDRNL